MIRKVAIAIYKSKDIVNKTKIGSKTNDECFMSLDFGNSVGSMQSKAFARISGFDFDWSISFSDVDNDKLTCKVTATSNELNQSEAFKFNGIDFNVGSVIDAQVGDLIRIPNGYYARIEITEYEEDRDTLLAPPSEDIKINMYPWFMTGGSI